MPGDNPACLYILAVLQRLGAVMASSMLRVHHFELCEAPLPSPPPVYFLHAWRSITSYSRILNTVPLFTQPI